jgi:putative sigma-54 modulation protein
VNPRPEEVTVQIEVRGRNTEVDDEIRSYVEKRFARTAQQVSDLATLDVELSEERNPAIRDSQIAEATLQLKGATLHAHEASPEMQHSIKLLAEDLSRQVKRHREKRRRRSQARRFAARLRRREA